MIANKARLQICPLCRCFRLGFILFCLLMVIEQYARNSLAFIRNFHNYPMLIDRESDHFLALAPFQVLSESRIGNP